MKKFEKTLLLGTAGWGWTVNKTAAFELLDFWLTQGFTGVDCATNYPINKQHSDFRAAEKILLEYIKAHGLSALNVTMKIGSLDNLRSPDINLSPSFIQMIGEEYIRLFGSNIKSLMLHWDNRNETYEVAASISALLELQRKYAIQPGISGIKHPEVYHTANETMGATFDIQVKHNVLQSDIGRYLPWFPIANHRYFAYGMTAGGIKLDDQPYPSESTFVQRGGNPEHALEVSEAIKRTLSTFEGTPFENVREMWQLGLIYAGNHPAISGMVIGVSSAQQLKSTLRYWQDVASGVFIPVFKAFESRG
ncbi:MAG: aldo/keto reductase [Saprospiraceae bacterium]|nr:aldo/keto reductase [Saprospiraceae bacterium]